jgi:nickel-dependent lactate racemase
MNLEIPYNKGVLSIIIPDKNLIGFKSRDFILREDSEEQIILGALSNPIDSPSLYEMVKGRSNVCLLVSDITRPCPSYKFLPYLIDELKKADVNDIKIVFGLGIHRKHTEEEKKKLAGEYAADNCRLIDFEPKRCKFVGRTSYETPVEVYEEVLGSELLIATGNIEYHYFAGYSGGAKAVMPGVCSRNSISFNHRMMFDDNASAGRFEGNPVRHDIEEAAKFVHIDFIFNVIINDDKRIVAAVCGKNNEAFKEGIRIYDSIYEISTEERADIVVVSPGGYPKDINLYQAQKALESVKDIVKEGGTIILAAACFECFGEDVFEQWMYYAKDYQVLYKKIKEEFILGGHKAVAVSKLLTKVNVLLYSEFDRNVTKRIGFKKIEDIQGYIDGEILKNKEIRIAVVTNGKFIKYVG